MLFIGKLDYPKEPKWMKIISLFCRINVPSRLIKHEAKKIPYGSKSKTKTKVLGEPGQRDVT